MTFNWLYFVALIAAIAGTIVISTQAVPFVGGLLIGSSIVIAFEAGVRKGRE